VARAKPTFDELFRPLGARGARARKASAPEDNPALQAIWDAVCRVPHGRVSTYGEVARLAGLPGRARQTGLALKVAPEEMHLPWHRVVGAGGRIVFPRTSPQHREQARRLRAEGVRVKQGRVDRGAVMRFDDF
jgi:methylated-DNA-protein-cysteine methyltransferase-like protein